MSCCGVIADQDVVLGTHVHNCPCVLPCCVETASKTLRNLKMARDTYIVSHLQACSLGMQCQASRAE